MTDVIKGKPHPKSDSFKGKKNVKGVVAKTNGFNPKFKNKKKNLTQPPNEAKVVNSVLEPTIEKSGKPKKIKINGVVHTNPFVKHRDGQKWFQYQVPGTVENPEKDMLTDGKSKEVFDEADLLLRTDNDLYGRALRSDGGSEASWLLNVVKKGTAADRMTAMQLQMHQSPIHSLPYVETLVSNLEKKQTREALGTIPILEDIFLNHYLPVNRKLISFSSRPLARLKELSANSEQTQNRMLVLWMFEHKLKDLYARFLKALEGVSAGVIVDLSKTALSAALNLLADRPEAEQALLTMIANKLGHPNYRVGAHVATLLENLTKRQPSMRAIIVKEVERVVYRKNVSDRAHLYASTFLSQVFLHAGEDELAVNMLSIYFGLFKTLIAKRKMDNRLLSILLSAANRAFPYAKDKVESLLDDINSLYKVVHTASYPVALQTLKLLFQVLKLSESLSDRYYTTLYRKLFDPIPPACYNQLMLLLYRSLKIDVSVARVRSFVKRLLQVATGASPAMAAGILILVSKLAEQKPASIVVKKIADPVAKMAVTLADDDEEERYVDIGADGKPIVRVKAEAKKEESECSGEDTLDDFDEKKEAKKPLVGTLGASSVGGWVHKGSRTMRSPYDQDGRNPLFIDFQQVADCELLLLAKHYHPSVAVFAGQLINGLPIQYKGDPLEDFTLMKFLDRFAYKNPKDGSAPVGSGKVMRKKAYDPWGMKKLAVSSTDYAGKNTDEMPADEKYLHRFAKLKFASKPNQEKKEEDWDHDSVCSEEFDNIIERFEPGEANDEFVLDADFGKEFTAEKNKKVRGEKRKAAEEEDGEDDEVDLDEDDDDDDEPEPDSDDEEEEDDDNDVEEDDEMDDDGGKDRAFGKNFGADDSGSEDDFGNNDAEVAADKFGVMLEEFEDDETVAANKKKHHKTRKPKGFKKRK